MAVKILPSYVGASEMVNYCTLICFFFNTIWSSWGMPFSKISEESFEADISVSYLEQIHTYILYKIQQFTHKYFIMRAVTTMYIFVCMHHWFFLMGIERSLSVYAIIDNSRSHRREVPVCHWFLSGGRELHMNSTNQISAMLLLQPASQSCILIPAMRT